jgi:hypothetical protein
LPAYLPNCLPNCPAANSEHAATAAVGFLRAVVKPSRGRGAYRISPLGSRGLNPEPSPMPKQPNGTPGRKLSPRKRRLSLKERQALELLAVDQRLTDARYEITLSSSSFLALVLGFSCLQISFAPLVLGPLVGRSGRRGTVNPGWAVAVMGVGAVNGSAMVAAYLATGYDPWLWAAAPGCLGSSTLLFIAACFWPRLRSCLK